MALPKSLNLSEADLHLLQGETLVESIDLSIPDLRKPRRRNATSHKSASNLRRIKNGDIQSQVSPKIYSTPKAERFPYEYIIDFNGAKAAIRAGYSTKSAATTAYKLLRKEHIQAKIKELIIQREQGIRDSYITDSSIMSAKEVLSEFSKIAKSDPGNAFDENGNVINIKDIPPEFRRVIKKWKVVKRETPFGDKITYEFETWDKLDALKSLSRVYGDLKDTMEIQGKDGGPVQIENVRTVNLDELTLEQKLALAKVIGIGSTDQGRDE